MSQLADLLLGELLNGPVAEHGDQPVEQDVAVQPALHHGFPDVLARGRGIAVFQVLNADVVPFGGRIVRLDYQLDIAGDVDDPVGIGVLGLKADLGAIASLIERDGHAALRTVVMNAVADAAKAAISPRKRRDWFRMSLSLPGRTSAFSIKPMVPPPESGPPSWMPP